jgi:hypothetical protein
MITACDTSPTFPALRRRASLARPRVTLFDVDLFECYLAAVRNIMMIRLKMKRLTYRRLVQVPKTYCGHSHGFHQHG